MPGARVFVQRIRRGGQIEDATADTVLQGGDIVAVAGPREVLVEVLGQAAQEVEDAELLNVPVEGVDVYVTSKDVDGKTLAELAVLPGARGVFLRRIVRGATATVIPILPNTKIQRGDILTIVGRQQDTDAGVKLLGVPDRPSDVADVAFIGGAITLGALIGAVVLHVGGVPLTLSTAGGALISGLVFGWLRSVKPTFGRIPSSTVWFMNSVGLNIFIAVVGISAGPGFVAGLQKLGISLFLWGIVATSVPLILAMYVGQVSVPLRPGDPAGLLRRSAHHHRCTRHDLRQRQEPGSGSRLYRDLRRRQHAADDLGHGGRDAADLTHLAFRRTPMETISLRKYETLSPFEIKDELIKIARRTTSQSNLAFLNAGRGNPNWIATKPREAFFLLGQFAITESRRSMDLPAGVGGMPQAPGIAARLDDWLAHHTDSPGAAVPWRDGPLRHREVRLQAGRLRA